jgi:hypothetical protein
VPKHDAHLVWRRQRPQTLDGGMSLAETICKAALALPDLLKNHLECAAEGWSHA